MSYTRPLPSAADLTWNGQSTYSRPAAGAANLVFAPATGAVTGVGAVTLGLFAAATAKHAVRGSGAATLRLSAAGVGRHFRRVVATTGAPWSDGETRSVTTRAVHGAAEQGILTVPAPWETGAQRNTIEVSPWGLASPRDDDRGAPWGFYERRLQPEESAPWTLSAAEDRQRQAPWGFYERRLQPEEVARWLLAKPQDDRRGARWGGPMLDADTGRTAKFATATAADTMRWVPWTKYSRGISPSWGIVIPVHTGDPEALFVVPVKRVYMQVNTASLRRVEGDVLLPVYNMSMSLDVDSWVWSFNASIHGDALGDVSPNEDGDPVELEAIVNGTTFRLLAERVTRERVFGRNTLQVTGRGKAALLDAPYAASQTFGNDSTRTLQQIMGDVLTVSGVPLDWTITFGPEDWLVPAGLFSHSGTYISALNQLAAAAGAYVQPHASDNELLILPRYPVAPWDWDTVDPDFEVPSAAMSRESIEWVDKPKYNRVYVAGVQGGYGAQVSRTGSAGDILAPMIVDPLMSVAAAARQRALPVLADTGRIAHTTLRMPVFTGDGGGILTPGKFVRYLDGATTRRGLVRSVSVEVGMPQVWQTFMVETHV